MPSGRLAGISVRPLRRQSTMLLLQLQLGGHTATGGRQGLDSVCAGPRHSKDRVRNVSLSANGLIKKDSKVVQKSLW